MSHFWGRNGTVPVQGGRRSFFIFAVTRCPWHSARTCDDVNRAQQGDMTPTSSQISERRKLAAIGIKAGKSQRLIARELNVTETTIRRDLEAQGITANKKPTATIRKPAVVFKTSSPAFSDSNVVSQVPTKILKPTPTPTKRLKFPPRPVFRRRVVPEPLKPEPPKPSGPEIPLSPEQLRQQHLEEMLQLVRAWLDERNNYYQHKENVLDKARIRLAARRKFPVPELPESPMSAAQLRDDTRPKEWDSAKSQGMSRREEVCATWLERWLAAWEPKDEQLRNQVINQTRARVTA